MRYIHGSGRPLFTEISANIRYYDKFRLYKLARDETLNKAFVALKESKNYTNEELQGRVLDVAFEIGGNILNRSVLVVYSCYLTTFSNKLSLTAHAT